MNGKQCDWLGAKSMTGGAFMQCRSCLRHGEQVEQSLDSDDNVCRAHLATAKAIMEPAARDRQENGGMRRGLGRDA